MFCNEIFTNGEGCNQSIPSNEGWNYCPQCGRLLARLDVSDATTTFRVKPGQSNTKQVILRSKGPAPLSVTAQLKPRSGLFVHFTNGRPEVVVTLASGLNGSAIALTLPPVSSDSEYLGTLNLSEPDWRQDQRLDPWKARQNRVRPLPIKTFLERPADIVPLTEALIFRPNSPERKLTVHNPGDVAISITHISTPTGYSIEPGNAHLEAGAKASFSVRLDLSVPRTDVSTLWFILSNDEEKPVTLLFERAKAARQVPGAIVGVDFGTAFTSVALRICSNSPNLVDNVAFLQPPNVEGASDDPVEAARDPARFRTRIFVGDDGTFEFGAQATRAYRLNRGSGLLIREVKTLLRLSELPTAKEPLDKQLEPFVYPPSRAASLAQLINKQGNEWLQSLVSRYLRWLRDRLINPALQQQFPLRTPLVKYVFSLPVLDFGVSPDAPKYKKQESMMKQCIREAGFPLDCVEFQFEPVCAALGLLNPENEDFPQLGSGKYPIQDGQHIALFDSGGGTTDVVLMKVVPDSNKFSLSVERCLGVDSELGTFGGELVTSRLLKAMKRAEDNRDGNWLSGNYSLITFLNGYKAEDYMRDSGMTLFKEIDTDDSLYASYGTATEYSSEPTGYGTEDYNFSDYEPADSVAQDKPIASSQRVQPPIKSEAEKPSSPLPKEASRPGSTMLDNTSLDDVFSQLRYEPDALRVQDLTETLKCELAPGEMKGIKVEGATIRPNVLEYITRDKLQLLRTEITERLFDRTKPEDINYYMSVGGNSSLYVFDKWVSDQMNDFSGETSTRRLHIPVDFRQRAIAYGAVWVPDARLKNAVAYGLRLECEGEDILYIQPNSSGELYLRQYTFEVGVGGSIPFILYAQYAGIEYKMAGATIESGDNPFVTVGADMQNGQFRLVRLNPNNTEENLIVYAL